MKQPLKQYLMSLRARNYSEHTLRAYELDLTEWATFLDGRTPTRIDLTKFASLLAERLDQISRVRHFASLRSFLVWQEAEGYLGGDLSDSIIKGKRPKRLPDVPSVEEVFHFLDGDFEYARDRAICELLYATGIRADELCGIDMDDFEGDRVLRVIGKGNKERRVIFGGAARRALVAWFDERDRWLQRKELDTSALFFGNSGPQTGRMDQRSIRRIIKQRAQARGFQPEAWHTHILRHAFACHCLDRGMALEAISQLLGHARLSTTQTYTQVATSKMIESYTKHHPHGAGTMPLSDAG